MRQKAKSIAYQLSIQHIHSSPLLTALPSSVSASVIVAASLHRPCVHSIWYHRTDMQTHALTLEGCCLMHLFNEQDMCRQWLICLSLPQNDLFIGIKHIDSFDNKKPYTPYHTTLTSLRRCDNFLPCGQKRDAGNLWDVLKSND